LNPPQSRSTTCFLLCCDDDDDYDDASIVISRFLAKRKNTEKFEFQFQAPNTPRYFRRLKSGGGPDSPLIEPSQESGAWAKLRGLPLPLSPPLSHIPWH